MGTITVPISLVTNSRCTQILNVKSDSTATISQFTSQLEGLLMRDGDILRSLTYKGAPPSLDSKLHNFASAARAHDQPPRFVACYKKSLNGDAQMPLRVLTLTGKTIPLLCRPLTSVKEVKEMIYNSVGIPPDQQRLIFAGRQLADELALGMYAIEQEATLHLVLRLRGGDSAAFADVSHSGSLLAMAFNPSAPRWRVARKGLNVEGICRNSICAAHGKLVIDGKGMVAFSLLADKAHCPECHGQFQPTTCAFYDCMWAFDGRKQGRAGPQDVSGAWKEASGGVYHRFQEHGNTVNWHSLILTTRHLTRGENKEPCPICFEDITNGIHTPGCNHSFHAECLEAWNRVRPGQGCPMCRTAL